MITAFDIYLISLIHNIDMALNIVFVVTLIFTIFCFLEGHDECYENEKKFMRWAKKSLILLLVIVSILIVIPSKKMLIAMYAVPTVLNNEKVQQLPDVFLDYIIEEFTVEKK